MKVWTLHRISCLCDDPEETVFLLPHVLTGMIHVRLQEPGNPGPRLECPLLRPSQINLVSSGLSGDPVTSGTTFISHLYEICTKILEQV